MKRILFLFTASLLLLACSNYDDQPKQEEQQEEEPTDLKLKKFSYVDATNYKREMLFDEDGQPTHENEKEPEWDLISWLYSYNSQGLISEKQYHYGAKLLRTDTFGYDSENKIESISYKSGDITSTYYDTHLDNTISIKMGNTFTTYYYNTEGVIHKIETSSDFSSPTTTIDYLDRNITKVTTTQSFPDFTETYLYEYDDSFNPLYEYVQNNYFNATIGDHSDLLSRPNYFSKNNFAKITYTSSEPDSDYIKTKVTEYDENGYPTRAIITKDDVFDQELSYEYY